MENNNETRWYIRFKPKNHNSGIYWIRANAGGGGKSSSEENNELEYPVWIYASAITAGIIVFYWFSYLRLLGVYKCLKKILEI